MSDQSELHPALPDLSGGKRTIATPIPPIVKIFTLVLFFLAMTPVLMYLAWLLTPSTPFPLLVIDKTSVDAQGVERASFFWMMKHRKLTKFNGSFYLPGVDYRGFHPLYDTTYLITGLEGMSESDVDSIADLLGGAYFVDTYGVSAEEWRTKAPKDDPSYRLYGGLSQEDLRLLTKLRNDGKPVLSEFNLFASPTSDSLRNEARELLGLRWTGWTGRYFATLDTVGDPEFPKWVLRSYERQYKLPWAYRDPGIIMVHLDGNVVVLEAGTYLADPIPAIVTEEELASYYGVPRTIPYPFWFDVTFPDERNGIVSKFVIGTNQYGDSLLAFYRLPREFPAVIQSRQPPLFYYFCMDASDNPIPPDFLASFKGIEWFDWFFYDASDLTDRRRFFWKYYFPMMSQILEELKTQVPPGKTSSR